MTAAPDSLPFFSLARVPLPVSPAPMPTSLRRLSRSLEGYPRRAKHEPEGRSLSPSRPALVDRWPAAPLVQRCTEAYHVEPAASAPQPELQSEAIASRPRATSLRGTPPP